MKKVSILFIIVLGLFACGKESGSPYTPIVPPAQNLEPEILKFQASPDTIKRGTMASLSWHVINSMHVEIDNGIGTVSPMASCDVEPLNDTEYTLTAKRGDIAVTKSCSIKVEPGGDVIITAGPNWKESAEFFSYYGKVKNRGTYKVNYCQLVFFLFDSNGNQIDNGRADLGDIEAGESVSWEITWYDGGRWIRKVLDKSKTKYEFFWDESVRGN